MVYEVQLPTQIWGNVIFASRCHHYLKIRAVKLRETLNNHHTRNKKQLAPKNWETPQYHQSVPLA
jgi:hypothetical protein